MCSFKDAFGSYVWDWYLGILGCLKRPFAVDGFQAMDCSGAEISGAFGSSAEAAGFPMGHPRLMGHGSREYYMGIYMRIYMGNWE